MPELYLGILPPAQRSLWHVLTGYAASLQDCGYYLAGGTALALQLGHRQSVDFDFFSEASGLAERTDAWLQQFSGYRARDLERDTLHGEVGDVKLSFIGAYRYPLIGPVVEAEGVRIAGLLDIGLMKLLTITHRATPRDYIDLAALIQSGYSLATLLEGSTRKFGAGYNPMVSLRALTSFEDVEGEMPVMLDKLLAACWKEILRKAVRRVAG